MQLRHEKLRLLVAICGITFAVILILLQLGFRDAMFVSATRYHERFVYDVAIFSVESSYLAMTQTFSSRRLYQALGVDGVASVSPVYAQRAFWKNPYNDDMRNVLAFGVDPDHETLRTAGVAEALSRVKRRDVVLFDGASRPEQGAIAERFAAGDEIETEVNDRLVRVAGVFTMGPSFGIDGSLLTSIDNFVRLFPSRSPGRWTGSA
jgi:putative ABC transport system permease protein